MQQVTVGGMELNHLKARSQRPAGSGFKRIDNARDAALIQLLWNRVVVIKGEWTWSHHSPAAYLPCLQASATLPGRLATCLASRMSQLNASRCALLLEEPRNARQRFRMLIPPDAHVGRRDPPLARDCRRFDKDQPDSTSRP